MGPLFKTAHQRIVFAVWGVAAAFVIAAAGVCAVLISRAESEAISESEGQAHAQTVL